MRTTTFLLTILFTIITFSPLYAASDRCPRHQIKTNLKSKLAKTRVFKGTSNDFSDYILGHHRGGKILGFVNQSEIYTKFKYKFEINKVGENKYCINLDEVKGYFYAAPKLYLPTDYKKSSCEYKQIRKHEQRHLNAVYNFHKRNASKFSSHLGRIARTIPVAQPTTKQEVEKVKQAIIDYFEGKFRSFEAKELLRLDAAQKKIDSPSEYIGVRKRCKNW